MKMQNIGMITMFSVFALAGTALGQNIQTNTSATTQGSTAFGFEPTQGFIETVIEIDTVAASGLTCGARVAGVMDCNSAAPGTNNAFVRLNTLPGSWTDSANPGTLNTSVNFACGGDRPFSTARAGNNPDIVCGSLFGDLQGQGSSAINETLSPNLSNPDTTRDFIGTLTNSVSFGTGATTAPNGFSTFTLSAGNDVLSGDAGFLGSIDQFIESTVSLGGTQQVVFRQRDSTFGLGSLLVPELIGASTSDATAAAVVPSFYTSGNPNQVSVGSAPCGFFFGQCRSLGMNSRVSIDQDGADDPGGNFGGMNLDVAVQFSGRSSQPNGGDFLTPGLNTGADPSVASGFGPEWNGNAFP